MTVTRSSEADHLTRLDAALKALNEARKFGEDDPRYSDSLRMVSHLYFAITRFSEGFPLVQKEYKILSKMGDDYPALDYNFYWMGVEKELAGDVEGARQLLLKALALSQAYPKAGMPSTSDIAAQLSVVSYAQGKFDEADKYARLAARRLFLARQLIVTAAEALKAELRGVHSYLNYAETTLDRRMQSQKIASKIGWKLKDAFSYTAVKLALFKYEECLKVNPRDSLIALQTADILAGHLADQGCSLAARRYAAEAYASAKKNYPDNYQLLCQLSWHLGQALKQLHEDEAEDILWQSIKYGKMADMCVIPQAHLLKVHYDLTDRHEDTLKAYKEALSLKGVVNYDPSATEYCYRLMANESFILGKKLMDSQKPLDAIKWFQESMQEAKLGKNRAGYLRAAQHLGRAQLVANKLQDAETTLRIFLDKDLSKQNFEKATYGVRARNDLMTVLSKTARAAEAKQLLEQNQDQKYFTDERDKYLNALKDLKDDRSAYREQLSALAGIEVTQAETLAQINQPKEARELYRTALTHYDEALSQSIEYYKTLVQFAELETNSQNYDAARKLLEKALIATRLQSGLTWKTFHRQIVHDLTWVSKLSKQPSDIEAHMAGDYVNRWLSLVETGAKAMVNRDYASARRTYDELYDLDKKTFGGDSVIVKSDLGYVLWSYWSLRDFKQLERSCKEWLSIKAGPIEREDEDIPVINSLAEAYNNLGKSKESETLLKQIEARKKDRLAGAVRLRWYQLLAAALMQQGKTQEAHKLYKYARESCGAQRCPLMVLETVEAYNFESLRRQGSNVAREEVKAITEELAQQTKISDRRTTSRAFLINELAHAYADCGENEKAFRSWKEAIQILEEKDPDNIVFRVNWMREYEKALRTAGRTRDADRIAAAMVDVKSLAIKK